MKYMWYRKSLGGILSSCYPLWHDVVIYPWTAKMCKQPLGCVAFCAVLITYSNKFARQSSYYLSVIAQRWDAHLPQLRSHTIAIKTKLCGHHTHSKSKRADNTSQKKKAKQSSKTVVSPAGRCHVVIKDLLFSDKSISIRARHSLKRKK